MNTKLRLFDHYQRRIGIAIVLLAISSSPEISQAETNTCKEVTRLPFVINASGTWCLKKSHVSRGTSGPAIEITRNNVVLDFNGFHITSRAGSSADTIGVQVDRKNTIQIRNGTVRGFRKGIVVSSAGMIEIDDMIARGNHEVGIKFSGVTVGSLRNNTVSSTGGTPLNVSISGIEVSGNSSDIRIIENDVDNTRDHASESTYGIRMQASASIVQGNRITNSAQHGIYSSNNTGVLIEGNKVTNPSGDVSDDYGIRMNAGSSTMYKDNMVMGFDRPFRSGIDAGGNFGI